MMEGDDHQADITISSALEVGDVERTFDLLDRELATADRGRRFEVLLLRGRLYEAIGRLAPARTDFSKALALADSPGQQSETYLARGTAALQQGDIVAARNDLEHALKLADAPQRRSLAEHALGRLEREHGDPQRAVTLLQNARDGLAAASAGEELLGDVTIDLAIGLRQTGRVHEGIHLLEALEDMADPPLRARVLIQLGTNYGFLGRTAEALHAYARALTLLPESDRAVVRYNRAVIFRELGESDRAQDELIRVLDDNAGTNPRVEYDALLLSGIIARENGDFQFALHHLGKAIAAADGDEAEGRARLELGTTLAAAGLFGPAITEFSAAIHLCTAGEERALALHRRGMSRRELGLVEQALDDFDRAFELTDDPDQQVRLQIARASLLASLAHRRDALDTLARVVIDASTPAARELLIQRGAVRAELGDLDGAIADLECATTLIDEGEHPHLLASVLVDLGTIYSAVGSVDTARECLSRAAAIALSGPLAHRALMTLGNLLVSQDEVLEALDVYEQAAAAAEDDRDGRAESFLARGNAALRLELYDQASADFARVMTLRPSDRFIERAGVGQRTVAQHLDHIRAMQEELSRAIAAADRPEYRAQPTLQRGMLALVAGDYDAAIIDVTRAIRLFGLRGEKASASAHLALVYSQLGRCDEALEALRGAASFDPDGAWKGAVRDDWRWRRCEGIWDRLSRTETG